MVICEMSCHKENAHVQYDSSITSGLKVMAKVKVFQKYRSNIKVKVKSCGYRYHGKGLIKRNTHV